MVKIRVVEETKPNQSDFLSEPMLMFSGFETSKAEAHAIIQTTKFLTNYCIEFGVLPEFASQFIKQWQQIPLLLESWSPEERSHEFQLLSKFLSLVYPDHIGYSRRYGHLIGINSNGETFNPFDVFVCK